MPSLAGQIWDTLSAINVNEHTEKKGNLTYLSWAWAWDVLMQHYPDSTYDFDPVVKYDDGTVEVWCTVTITHGDQSMFRRMWLPVMDHRNNAIQNPDARQISDTRMRCLVKCLAMFGLAHYIFSGEDLPSNAPPYSEQEKKAFDDFLVGSALGLWLFRKRVGDETYIALYNSFEPGQKVANKKLADDQERIGLETYQAIVEGLEGENHLAVAELVEDESNTVIALLKSQLNGPQRNKLTDMLKAAA